MTTRAHRKPVPVTPELRERAAAVHRSAIVIDGMCTDHIEDPHNKLRWNEPYLQRLFDGGITALNRGGAHYQKFADGVKAIRKFQLRAQHCPERTLFVRTADDIRRAKREGKVGIIAGFQTSVVIEDDVDYVEALYQVGARCMQITYNERCYVGDGCQERNPAGLSHFGVDVVKEMNRIGFVVDLAHVSDATAKEAAALSTKPVIISHSACGGLRPNPRSATDELIRLVAKTGGVIGICFLPFLLDRDGRTRCTFEDFLRHIDHVVDMVGVDHVGFGTDLTEEINPTEMMTETGELGNWPNKPYRPVVYPPLPWIFPPEIDSLSKMGNITLGLLARGYSDEDARKIMGGNFLRVFSEVWR
jgi:membrane dipeptidase